jgi:SAM-dependent methyltransferase
MTGFSTVTEMPGNQASAEQLRMIRTRYRLAGEFARDKDVLEAACGPGRGLGYLVERARSVIGGDLDPVLVEAATRHYQGRVRVLRFDAQRLPFAAAAFDVVILLEALYYLREPQRFLSEAHRVLRPRGTLLLCLPNKEWAGFNPSPFSMHYFSASELRGLLEQAGFRGEIRAGFPADSTNGWKRAVVSWVRSAAVAAGLIPKTMAGKAFLKRIFYGGLTTLGPEIDTRLRADELCEATDGRVRGFKVLYAIARKL